MAAKVQPYIKTFLDAQKCVANIENHQQTTTATTTQHKKTHDRGPANKGFNRNKNNSGGRANQPQHGAPYRTPVAKGFPSSEGSRTRTSPVLANSGGSSPLTPEDRKAKEQHETTAGRMAPLVRRYLAMVLLVFINRRGESVITY